VLAPAERTIESVRVLGVHGDGEVFEEHLATNGKSSGIYGRARKVIDHFVIVPDDVEACGGAGFLVGLVGELILLLGPIFF
jgi:hypothetical protein